MARGQTARKTTPGDAKLFLGKAVEFLEVAKIALEKDLLSPAVGNAINAGISGADAVCTIKTGEISQGQHEDAVEKVRAVDKAIARNLSRLLHMKTRAQYDPQDPSPKQAKDAVEAADRIVARAGQIVNPEA
jgi:uncharacterized protein (UPF0332 family)